MMAALLVTVCLFGTEDCRTFETGVQMPFTACRGVQGQIAALEWLRQRPEFEFAQFYGWGCDTSEGT